MAGPGSANNYLIAALEPQKAPRQGRAEKFGYSK